MAGADLVETLRRVPLFSRLSNKDLKKLSKVVRERSFEDGEKIAVQGRAGVGFFVIASGEAVVTRDGEQTAKLEAGDWIGEMALIDKGVRSATVTAVGKTRCWVMTDWEFRPFIQQNGEVAWTMLEALVARIRASEP